MLYLGLPIENYDFPIGYVSHNQMVVSFWMVNFQTDLVGNYNLQTDLIIQISHRVNGLDDKPSEFWGCFNGLS